MIISHSRRFIFIKTRKTAGTSVELFLSQFCDEGDILTPLGKDEALRTAGVGPRNFEVSGNGRKNRALRLLANAIRRPALGYGGYYPHIPAVEIRRLLGDKTWNDYFKFTIERNPWDRQVSLYHWHYRNKTIKPSFDLFVRSPIHRKISPNFDTYAIDDAIATDFVCRYESLGESLDFVLKQIGVDAKVELPRAKGNLRTGPHWRDYYTSRTRDLVGRWYNREIDALGYSFTSNED